MGINFFTFIFLNMFSAINSLLYLHFPTAIQLQNGNFFVISQNAFVITNSSYSSIINYSYNFLQEEKISDINDLSKVSISQFDDGYIFALVINKIYIFNNEGEYQTKYSLNDIEVEDTNDLDDLYYIFKPHKYNNNYYYYLIGTIYNNTLYLSYYSYYSTNKSFSKITNNEFNYLNYDENYIIQNNGLSCEFLYSKREIILCM